MGAPLPSAEAYANEPVRHPPLVVVDVGAEHRAVTEEYRSVVLSRVNASCLRLAVFHGEYRWHHHPTSDELFLVVEGGLELDRAGRRRCSCRRAADLRPALLTRSLARISVPVSIPGRVPNGSRGVRSRFGTGSEHLDAMPTTPGY